MNTALSTASFYPMDLEKSAETAVRLGYKAIEVFVNCQLEYSKNYISKLHNLLDLNGVRISSVHPYTSGMEPFLLFSEYTQRRNESLEYYRQCIQATSLFGAKIFVLHGPSDKTASSERPDELDIEVYGRLCDFGDEYGVTVAQENVKLFLSRSPEYLERLSSIEPRLGFNLDIKQARRAGRHESEFIKIMRNKLVNVHINDVDANGSCRLPGEGTIDFVALLSSLRSIGYDGALVTEVYRDNFKDELCLAKSKSFLEHLIKNSSF